MAVVIIHFKNTQFGFEWGNANLSRGFDDDKHGWVTIILETDKYKGNRALQIYVTKTGKVRIHDASGEWKRPAKRT